MDTTIAPSPATTTTDIPAESGAGGPAASDERGSVSRRKKLILLALLLLTLILVLLSVWYLMFRKPLTELPIPVVDRPMPAYQATFSGLSKPQSVAVTSDGQRIYVTETGSSLDTVLLDRNGTKLAVLQPPADLVAQAHQLFVAINPLTNEVWATDRYNTDIAIYSADGKFLRLFDPGQDLTGWQPLGIGFDANGDAYVVDVSATAVIRVFGPDGSHLRDFGASSGLNHPNGVLVTSNGMVYLTDTGNGRLLIFDQSGTEIGLIDRGASDGNLGLPVGIGLDDHDRVMVVDSSSSAVQAYAQLEAGQRGPRYINAFGAKGTDDGQMSFPNGLAADGRGRVYVADWGNDRLVIWSY